MKRILTRRSLEDLNHCNMVFVFKTKKAGFPAVALCGGLIAIGVGIVPIAQTSGQGHTDFQINLWINSSYTCELFLSLTIYFLLFMLLM